MFKKLKFPRSITNKLKIRDNPKFKNYSLFVLGAIALAILVVFLVLSLGGQKGTIKQSSQNNQQVFKKSAMSLAQGKQIYFIKTDNPQNPQILQVSLDPLDVKVGKTQILTVKVKHSDKEAITNKNAVIATYYTDNDSSTIRLKLRRVDGPPLVTTWQGVWTAKDTYNNIYMCSIKAVSAAGKSKVDLSFR